MTNSKWSTPTLKARWYDDESIAAVGVAVDSDVQAAQPNTMKAGPADVPLLAVSTQVRLDRAVSTGEPPTG